MLLSSQLQMAMDRSSSLHSGMRANIEKVRTDFRACIRQNEMADEDERLPRQASMRDAVARPACAMCLAFAGADLQMFRPAQEFVIDRELRNILLTEGNERIKKIQV